MSGWRDDAACRTVDWSVFFPGYEGDVFVATLAKRICRPCPARSECLAWALEHHEVGIWGATTTEERVRLRRAAHRDELEDGVARFDVVGST